MTRISASDTDWLFSRSVTAEPCRPVVHCRPAAPAAYAAKATPQRHRCHGFTLLEVLLVLGILGMAAVLVIPGLRSLDSPSFNAQVRELSGMFNYARRTAVVQGQPAQVQVWASAPSEDDMTNITGAVVGRWVAEGMSVEYADSTQRWRPVEEQHIVEFYPEGGSTGGDFQLQQGNRVVILTIDPFSGRLSRREPD